MYPALISIAIVVVVFLVWRLASRRESLPCPVWLRWMVELDNPFTKTNRAAEIISHLGLEQGMKVADVGCGPGRLVIPLAKAVGPSGSVTAMDIQSGMLERVREKAAQAGVSNIVCLNTGVGEGRLGESAYDRIVLVTVLGEIPDREATMRELFAALKPSGILSVTEVIFDPHFQRRSTVAALAIGAGFSQGPMFGNSIAWTGHFVKE